MRRIIDQFQAHKAGLGGSLGQRQPVSAAVVLLLADSLSAAVVLLLADSQSAAVVLLLAGSRSAAAVFHLADRQQLLQYLKDPSSD